MYIMVYSRGPARFTALICNKTNVCGGNRKSGLSGRIGQISTNNSSIRFQVNTTYGMKCSQPKYIDPSQVAIRNARRGLHGLA